MELTHERLVRLLNYDSVTGHFWWRETVGPNALVGSLAGSVTPAGYCRIVIDGFPYVASRLVWFYHYRVWPTYQIDHIDGDKGNDRLENLRDVPQRVNLGNQHHVRRNNKTGLLGVSKRAWSDKYQANIGLNGRNKYLGTFNTPLEAHNAYMAARSLKDQGKL